MLTPEETRKLLNNMVKSQDCLTKELGDVVYGMCNADPYGHMFTQSTLDDTDRCLNILKALKLRLEGWTHPGCNNLEW